MTSAKTMRHPAELVAAGLVPPQRLAEIERVAARYAVAITPAIRPLIDAQHASDPIARQFVPDRAELDMAPHERADPIGDEAHCPVEGIVHRYPDRVLLKLTHICAVYCRFCFRREMVGPQHGTTLSADAVAGALRYIGEHPDIWEVILTGGDPLVLSARRLADVMHALARIDHVRIVRLHTRVPVVDPARVTPALLRALKASRKATYVALHANHPRELGAQARAAIARIVDAGIPMLSQTVLLRGVNDDAQTLADLMRAFVECRIKPYYLHHCDLAPGTAQFRTTVRAGQHLMRELRGRLSGLAQPTYVLDIPGGDGKSPVGPEYLTPVDGAGERYLVEDFCGQRHVYPPTEANGSSE
jgi:lysine 2,3-aminomutase